MPSVVNDTALDATILVLDEQGNVVEEKTGVLSEISTRKGYHLQHSPPFFCGIGLRQMIITTIFQGRVENSRVFIPLSASCEELPSNEELPVSTIV